MSKLIYLASTAYTGSTLISILLGSHPDITTISELVGVNTSTDVTRYPCSCGDLLVHCQFFEKVARQFEKGDLEFSYQNFDTRFHKGNRILRKLLYGSLRNNQLELIRDSLRELMPDCRRSIKNWSLRNRAMINSILEVSGKKVFLDASKDPRRIVFMAQLYKEPMYVLHLTRDVRGYVNSCKKNQGTDVEIAARSWVLSHRDIRRNSRKIDAPYMRVKYEDICTATSSSIREICLFCGLQHKFDVKFAPKVLHLIGNRMRLGSDSQIRLDEAWKHDLTDGEQGRIFKIAGDLMTEFEYC